MSLRRNCNSMELGTICAEAPGRRAPICRVRPVAKSPICRRSTARHWSSSSRASCNENVRRTSGADLVRFAASFRASFCTILPSAFFSRLQKPLFIGLFVVLPVRIELTTSPLPRGCSTTELRQRRAVEISKSGCGHERGDPCHKGQNGASAAPRWAPFPRRGTAISWARERSTEDNRKDRAAAAALRGATRKPQAP
jgi:hypothetical protein